MRHDELMSDRDWMDHMQGRLRVAQVICVLAILGAAAAVVLL